MGPQKVKAIKDGHYHLIRHARTPIYKFLAILVTCHFLAFLIFILVVSATRIGGVVLITTTQLH